MLLDSSNNAITTQGIYFELKENGYAGDYQPAEDFRDEVLDALSEAQASATQAAQSASTAQASATQAQTSQTAASASATQAATSAQSAQSASTAAQGYAQQAADSASQAVQTAGVNALKISKKVIDGFYFNGGSLQNNTAQISVPFSVCATIDSQYSGGVIFSIGNTGAHFFEGIVSLTDGTNTLSTASLGVGLHALVFVVTSSGAKIFADGVQAATASTFAFSPTSAGYEFWKNDGNEGRISRAKIFNFDMSASGAAYTPQDYADGIEPNGILLAGGASYTQANTWTSFSAKNYSVYTTGGIGVQFSESFSGYYGVIYLMASSPIPAGSTITCSTGNRLGVSEGDNFIIRFNARDESRSNNGQLDLSPNQTGTITTTAESVRLEVMFSLSSLSGQLGGKYLAVDSLEMRINGATVNLADVAQGYQVADTSANGNHAMLVGTALADKTAAQALVRGAYTWSGSTGAYWLADSSVLPANCQVELWAKASAAATLNLGYDTRHATTFGSAKSVSTAWTNVASWTMGAIPRKLFVTPSSADLSVQFYLKITSIK